MKWDERDFNLFLRIINSDFVGLLDDFCLLPTHPLPFILFSAVLTLNQRIYMRCLRKAIIG